MLDHHRERAPGVDMSGSIGMDASAQLTEELTMLEEAQGRVQRLKGKAILDDAKHQLTIAGVKEITTTQRHGTLLETLEEFEPRCDLVIVGKRGTRADLARNHLGANLELPKSSSGKASRFSSWVRMVTRPSEHSFSVAPPPTWCGPARFRC